MKKILLIVGIVLISCSKTDNGDRDPDPIDETGNPPSSTVCINSNDLTSVQIGNQIWTDKNIDIKTYCDGTVIPQVESTEWYGLTTGAWTYAKRCWDNDFYPELSETEIEQYGILYNWYAIMGIHDNDPNTPNKKFAPDGWRVPDVDDFEILFSNSDAPSLRQIGVITSNERSGLWYGEPVVDPFIEGTNSTGFSAVPAGVRIGEGNDCGTGHGNIGIVAFFWTSSELNSNPDRAINSVISSLEGSELDVNDSFKRVGMSVRLIKN